MSNWEVLVSDEELAKAKRVRRKKYVDGKYPLAMRNELESQGFEFIQNYKDGKKVKMRRYKHFDVLFENRVWLLLNSMGFCEMNRDSTFKISYGENDPSLTQQIDVFATDGETVLIIECKAAENAGTRKDFKTEIEAFSGIRNGLIKSIKEKYGRQVRIKFIWATSNILLGKDVDRLTDAGIEYFDEESISYYEGLAKHLGSASKYQLLGRLFANQDIKGMENRVPAIKGKMGGHTYYSFSIEPERLLKIGYVLHRDDANRNMMPTYQRVIKKTRLDSVRAFVNNGGYFPNSIVISIDAPKGGLRFDAKPAEGDNISKLGVLHLPKKYRTAYIIDGQHRLYGYSDSIYASKNTIPVVAFENLSQEEQIRLFMEINENQKAVSKNLRNTLNADLLWTSENYSERRKALRLKIAEYLGENESSPLYDRVLIGENTKTDTCCITMDTIDDGLRYGKFITSFSNNMPADPLGYFDSPDESNDFAYSVLPPFLIECFNYFRDSLPDEWEAGEGGQGVLTNNTGVNALLRILSDVLDHVARETDIQPRQMSAEAVFEYCRPMLGSIVRFYKTMSPETREEIKNQYGGKGVIKHWRYFQRAIKQDYKSFSPSGLDEWWANNSKEHNDETRAMLEEITAQVTKWVWDFLTDKGLDIPIGLDVKLYDAARKSFYAKGIDHEPGKREKWSFATLADCLTVANYRNYWSEGLNKILTRPNERDKRSPKATKTQWMGKLHKVASGLTKSGYSVKNDDYEYISAIFEWVREEGKGSGNLAVS